MTVNNERKLLFFVFRAPVFFYKSEAHKCMFEAFILQNCCDVGLDSTFRNYQMVFKGRFIDNLTLEATAKSIGRTRERVRQMEAKILRKCRRPEMKKELLKFTEGYAI